MQENKHHSTFDVVNLAKELYLMDPLNVDYFERASYKIQNAYMQMARALLERYVLIAR